MPSGRAAFVTVTLPAKVPFRPSIAVSSVAVATSPPGGDVVGAPPAATVKFPPPFTVSTSTVPARPETPGRIVRIEIDLPPSLEVVASTRGPESNCAGPTAIAEVGFRLIPKVKVATSRASGMMLPVVVRLARPPRLAPKSSEKPPAAPSVCMFVSEVNVIR